MNMCFVSYGICNKSCALYGGIQEQDTWPVFISIGFRQTPIRHGLLSRRYHCTTRSAFCGQHLKERNKETSEIDFRMN